MDTQSGARTPLVDPFGRELEEWLRDAPATRAPYLADLVVPPVTGPVQRPDTASEAAPEVVDASVPPLGPVDDAAFRRPRDRARHAAACAPSFPEPPERIALRIEDLAVEVSAASGRTTIERIVLLEDEVRRRDEDLARLAAWEASVAETDDAEVEAARAFARSVFADLLADAALEADRRDRAAARRAATGRIAAVSAGQVTEPTAAAAPVETTPPALPELVEPTSTTLEPDEPVRPAPRLPIVSPVAATTRPTPLVLPATGPTVVDRAAFAAALTAHAGTTASTPVVLPEAVVPSSPEPAAPAERSTTVDEAAAPAAAGGPGWWSRVVAGILRLLGRR